ncbi:MAG: transcriptional repressor AgaR [Cellvibrio sp.]|uniref:transcriptional repressor AgaR n=1 Tax=Cellvibrio sp. TaxID=1965322 RepID=UPI0031A4D440
MISTAQRRLEIVNLTQDRGQVSINELCAEYGVSAVTIRNDIRELHNRGLIVQSRGGALKNDRLTQELSVREKSGENILVKQRLGKMVAELVSDGDSIILDSGTTTLEVAHCLSNHKNLVVMTNGLNIALELSKTEDIEVLLTGGKLRRKSQSFYGRQAEESLNNLRFNKAIIGVDGFDINGGITTYFEPEACLNRLMCESAAEVIAVTDSSKFTRHSLHLIRPLSKINTVVTDDGINKEHLRTLTQQGIKVLLVKRD